MGNTSTRTVRFTDDELKDIESFLKKNPFFDFSTLARLAISDFIRNPKLEVSPILEKKRLERKQGDSHV